MVFEGIHTPGVSEEMGEVTLASWTVAPGDRARKGDVPCSVGTGKAGVDVESAQQGVVRSLLVPEGSVVKRFAEIATIGTA